MQKSNCKMPHISCKIRHCIQNISNTSQKQTYANTIINLLLILIPVRFLCYIEQGWGTLIPEGRCPAEFSSNPNQTHLNQLIKVFRMQLGIFFQGFFRVGAKLCRRAALQDQRSPPLTYNCMLCFAKSVFMKTEAKAEN